MADAPAIEQVAENRAEAPQPGGPARSDPALSLRSAWRVLASRRRPVLSVVLGLPLVCLLYCLVAPNQYESRARVALRTSPATSLGIAESDGTFSGSLASGQTQLETLANVLRSDQLAWRVILDAKLYRSPAFSGGFAGRFPDFRPEHPSPEAESDLLRRFQRRLRVSTIPRTLLLEIAFRSGDASLSAQVVSALIRAYEQEEEGARLHATEQAAGWLRDQLRELKAKSDHDDDRLAAFQNQHRIVITPETLSNGQSSSAQHASALLEVDELGRSLAAASAERILREAEYRAAAAGDPELVLAADNRVGDSGDLSLAVFRQIHARRGDLQEELSQLNLEHGPNFPRVVEIREQLQELDRQLQTADDKLRDRYKRAWQVTEDREQLLRHNLDERTAEGLQVNAAAIQYESMRREAEASRVLYLRVQGKAEEAGLIAGVPNPDFRVVDAPRVPARRSSPDTPFYLAITLFVSAWLAAALAFLMESLHPSVRHALLIAGIALAAAMARAQAPTPSTSGLPAGVAHIPQSHETRSTPNPKGAPPKWSTAETNPAGPSSLFLNLSDAIPAPIAPGDLLDVSEFHTPEFRCTVRVTAAGTVSLPMVGDVAVLGLDEPQAAQVIAASLVEKGMLRHPQVRVLVMASIGQDVSVLGEVTHPGVYPYGAHHRLLDLIAAAAGTTPAAGALAYLHHRDDPQSHTIVLDRAGVNADDQHNPELEPGDTVEVSRAGLVYVVGDVIRPGGFTLESGQPMTVLQAISLAWGPTQNASLQKALLIHERPDGNRAVVSLNLKRMLRGQDPDMPIGERDILFVPDSAAKNIWNRTMESVVQSTVGVGIYAGLVYSQRF